MDNPRLIFGRYKKGDGTMDELVWLDIYLKNGKVLRIKANDSAIENILKNMSTNPGSAIVLDHCGFIACSEIAAVMRVDGKVDVS